MRGRVLFLPAVLLSFGAWASEPGQPLDCTDWVFLEPGLSCTQVLSQDCILDPLCNRGGDFVLDNESRVLSLRYRDTGGTCGYRIEVVGRVPLQQTEIVLAYLQQRCGDGDYITVSDALPNPAAGQGYYYVTAATYQGQTRYGRKAMNGRLSGRDPGVLPGCLQP